VTGDCQSIVWDFGYGTGLFAEYLRVSDSYCGDGILDLDLDEICDDGNLVNGDGCDLFGANGFCQPTP
jgi:cysteine-rich repeat protein